MITSIRSSDNPRIWVHVALRPATSPALGPLAAFLHRRTGGGARIAARPGCLVVGLPGPAAAAWVLAEAGHRYAASLGAQASIGLHVCTRAEDVHAAMGLAARAADAALRYRLSVATSVLDRALAHAEAVRSRSTLESRRDALLDRLDLGPTQADHLTGHSDTVALVAHRLAAALGLDDGHAETLRLAGLLHDIGKCAIPETILAKAGSLDDDERSVMDHHAAFGRALADALGAPPAVLDAVHGHHDRFDERSARLGIGARILAVADALATMMSDRPYRSARDPRDSLAELRRHQGLQFDPDVVDAAHRIETATRRRAA